MEGLASVTQLQNGPNVPKREQTLHFPLHGTDDEAFNVTINNPSMERIAFKITSSKMDKFTVKPRFGIIESKNSIDVEFIPKPQASSDGWNKFDHIAVHLATAPKGNLWKAKEIWDIGPKDVKRYEIKLKAMKGQPKPEPEPEPVLLKKPAKKGPTGKTDAPNVAKLKVPYMEPSTATIQLPCDGTEDDILVLYIQNPTMARMCWKIKCTKGKLFIIEPMFGWLEPMHKATINCQPEAITNKQTFNENDHFLVTLADAPKGNLYEPEQLWKGKCAIQLVPKETLKVKIRGLNIG